MNPIRRVGGNHTDCVRFRTMAAWLRREHEPDKSLTDARKELVHSYMDAEESEARREAIERLERQSHTREQARPLAAEEAVRRRAATATDAGQQTADDAARRSSVPECRAQRRTAGDAKRRGDEARREDDEVARLVAAAAAGAREEARREAEEETARQVAAAVEAALREAKDETARQVAEAVAHARQEAAEAARQGGVIAEPAPEQPREPELEEPAPPVAATLGEARPRAPGKTDMEPAGEAARREAAIAETTREDARQETGEETPRGVVATAEQPAGRNSTEGLPLYERIEAATQPDEATARVDWTRELLRTTKNARTS